MFLCSRDCDRAWARGVGGEWVSVWAVGVGVGILGLRVGMSVGVERIRWRRKSKYKSVGE